MSIKLTPGKRFTDPRERLSYKGLDLLSRPTGIVEPNSVGGDVWKASDIIAGIAAVDTESVSGSITTAVLVAAVPAAGSALLSTVDSADIAEVPLDSVVTCDQRDSNLYYTGWVETYPDGLGGVLYRIRFAVKNFGTGTHDVSIGTVLRYSVFSGEPQTLPKTPNTQLIVTPGFLWIDPATGEPPIPPPAVNVGNMNFTAKPTVQAADGTITEVELRSDDMAKYGALYTGRRATFTLGGNTDIPVGAAVLLGVLNFIGPAGPNIIVGQVNPVPLFTGYVSASNGTTTISIYARNNGLGIIHLLAGLQLKVFAY